MVTFLLFEPRIWRSVYFTGSKSLYFIYINFLPFYVHVFNLLTLTTTSFFLIFSIFFMNEIVPQERSVGCPLPSTLSRDMAYWLYDTDKYLTKIITSFSRISQIALINKLELFSPAYKGNAHLHHQILTNSPAFSPPF